MGRFAKFSAFYIAFCLLLLPLVSCAQAKEEPVSPGIQMTDTPPFDRMPAVSQPLAGHGPNPFDSAGPKIRAVWISYLELTPMLMGKSRAAFAQSFDNAMAFCAASGLDTVFVQVRPFADALYPSELFPYSHIITGERGKEPDFDPLEVMLASARKHRLSFHAWINPYRISWTENAPFPKEDPIASRKDVLIQDKKAYLNPASDEARNLIAAGAKELLTRYPAICGIHMDDYFYPTTDPAFDKASYDAYVKGGGKASLQDFRQQQVTALCARLQKEIKSVGKNVRFGISPAGNLQNVTKACCFDPAKVAEAGFVDYLCPQIYFGYHNDSQPFSQVLAQWKAVTKDTSCSLLVGLPFYKSGKEDAWAGSGKREFLTPGVLPQMTEQLLQDKTCSGLAYYSLASLLEAEGTARIDWINCKGRLLAHEKE